MTDHVSRRHWRSTVDPLAPKRPTHLATQTKALAKRVLPPSTLAHLRKVRSQAQLRRIGLPPVIETTGVEYIGTEYGGYAVPKAVVQGTVALSFGAGEDISFEIGIAKRLNVAVHVFDPTPRAVEFGRRAGLELREELGEDRIHCHSYGVWSESKTLRFYEPANPDHVSHSVVNLQGTERYFEAECLSPADILRRLGLSEVSLVKLNVEGAEYEIVNSMFDAHFRPTVICIALDELHSPMDGRAVVRLRGLIRRILGEGYLPIHARHPKVTFCHQATSGSTQTSP